MPVILMQKNALPILNLHSTLQIYDFYIIRWVFHADTFVYRLLRRDFKRINTILCFVILAMKYYLCS